MPQSGNSLRQSQKIFSTANSRSQTFLDILVIDEIYCIIDSLLVKGCQVFDHCLQVVGLFKRVIDIDPLLVVVLQFLGKLDFKIAIAGNTKLVGEADNCRR